MPGMLWHLLSHPGLQPWLDSCFSLEWCTVWRHYNNYGNPLTAVVVLLPVYMQIQGHASRSSPLSCTVSNGHTCRGAYSSLLPQANAKSYGLIHNMSRKKVIASLIPWVCPSCVCCRQAELLVCIGFAVCCCDYMLPTRILNMTLPASTLPFRRKMHL